MSQITIKTGAVINANGVLHSDVARLLQVKDGLSSLRYGLDSRISARRNIAGRLNNACNSINLIESQMSKLESFINDSVNRYMTTDHLLNDKAPNVGVAAAAAKGECRVGVAETVKQTKNSFWGDFCVGLGVVTAPARNVCAQFKKNIEPKGKWHQAYNIGKAAVGLTTGLISVAGSLAIITASGGTATPVACMAVAYGLNGVFNNTYDLVLSISNKNAETGKFNLLKSEEEFIGESIGKLSGHEKEGKLIADGIYYGGEIVTVYNQLDKLKDISLGKVGHDVVKLGNTDVSPRAIDSIKNLVLNEEAPINIACHEIKGIVKAGFKSIKIADGILSDGLLTN